MIRTGIAVLALLLGLAAPVRAQVVCTTPDDLCTGDPCVIPSLTVIGPCVLDFGSRTVVVSGRLRVPRYPFGDLDFTAGRIEVPGAIQAVDLDGGTPHYSLTATQDLSITGVIRANQPRAAGAVVTLSAGGNIDLGGLIRGGTALYADAGGIITVTGRLRHSTHELRGAAGVNLQGGRIDNRATGFFGGDLDIESSGGEVILATRILANNYTTSATTITAAGNVSIQQAITIRYPGTISPTLLVTAGNDVTVDAAVWAKGADIEIVAGGAVTVNDDVRVDGPFSIAGTLRVEGASVQVGSTAMLDATAAPVAIPGALRLQATAGDMVLAGLLTAKEGLIEATATGNLTASGNFVSVGAVPGCIGLSAGGVLDTSAGSFDQAIVPDCPG